MNHAGVPDPKIFDEHEGGKGLQELVRVRGQGFIGIDDLYGEFRMPRQLRASMEACYIPEGTKLRRVVLGQMQFNSKPGTVHLAETDQ